MEHTFWICTVYLGFSALVLRVTVVINTTAQDLLLYPFHCLWLILLYPVYCLPFTSVSHSLLLLTSVSLSLPLTYTSVSRSLPSTYFCIPFTASTYFCIPFIAFVLYFCIPFTAFHLLLYPIHFFYLLLYPFHCLWLILLYPVHCLPLTSVSHSLLLLTSVSLSLPLTSTSVSHSLPSTYFCIPFIAIDLLLYPFHHCHWLTWILSTAFSLLLYPFHPLQLTSVFPFIVLSVTWLLCSPPHPFQRVGEHVFGTDLAGVGISGKFLIRSVTWITFGIFWWYLIEM